MGDPTIKPSTPGIKGQEIIIEGQVPTETAAPATETSQEQAPTLDLGTETLYGDVSSSEQKAREMASAPMGRVSGSGLTTAGPDGGYSVPRMSVRGAYDAEMMIQKAVTGSIQYHVDAIGKNTPFSEGRVRIHANYDIASGKFIGLQILNTDGSEVRDHAIQELAKRLNSTFKRQTLPSYPGMGEGVQDVDITINLQSF